MKSGMITAVVTFARKGCKPALLAAAVLALSVTPLVGSKPPPRIAPPNSKAYGRSLTWWLTTYWDWYYSGADMAKSKVGMVQLMPLPVGEQTGGEWTPDDPAVLEGYLEVTLRAGTPFVLPTFAWVGERYEGYPAVPDDPPMDNAVALAGIHPTLTIDGVTVMSDANKAAFYIPPTYFDPIVLYPTPTGYGSVAGVFFQGFGLVSLPLSVGEHVIHLYEPVIIPPGAYPLFPDGLGLVYDNTWIITVVPK